MSKPNVLVLPLVILLAVSAPHARADGAPPPPAPPPQPHMLYPVSFTAEKCDLVGGTFWLNQEGAKAVWIFDLTPIQGANEEDAWVNFSGLASWSKIFVGEEGVQLSLMLDAHATEIRPRKTPLVATCPFLPLTPTADGGWPVYGHGLQLGSTMAYALRSGTLTVELDYPSSSVGNPDARVGVTASSVFLGYIK